MLGCCGYDKKSDAFGSWNMFSISTNLGSSPHRSESGQQSEWNNTDNRETRFMARWVIFRWQKMNSNRSFHSKPPLGSIGFAAQVVGSIISGFISEAYGRKKALWLINIPHLIAWALLYWATSLTEIFIGVCLLGLVIGLINSPCAVYTGEVRWVFVSVRIV